MYQSVISIDVIDHDKILNTNELIQSTTTIVSEPSNNNNYLAIDCNLESYSSLSSSSSSSSCSSAADPVSSNTNVSNGETSNLQLLTPNKSTSKTNGSTSLFKNKIINSLKRRNSLHLSNECLSSDEGYVGSYSDINKIPIQSNNSTNLVDQQQKQTEMINLLMNHLGQYLNEQEKVNLINYLVNHKFDLNNNDSIINQTNLIDYDEDNNFNSLDYDNLYEMNSIDYNEDELSYKIEIPALFDIKNETEINQNSYAIDYDYFDISNRLNFNHNFHELNYNLSESINDPYCCYFCDFYDQDHYQQCGIPNFWEQTYQNNIECLFKMSNYELRQLYWETSEKKLEETRRMELELMNRENWRIQLRKLTNLRQFQSELNREDEIDMEAYLNEIDMNLDYLQYDSIYLETSGDTLNDCIDQLLKFQNNKMAFNLKKYHLELEKSNVIKRIFENFDNIPEFRPIIINDHDQNDEYIISNEAINDENKNNNDLMIDIENLENDSLSNMNNNEEENTLFLMDTTLAANQDIDEYLTLTEEGAEIIQNNEYYQENFDYEDYEDQLYIDSLTEEEALILLRSESELYALQMAQAAKTGILKEQDSTKNPNSTTTTTIATSATTKSKKSKKSKKKKRRFNSSESASTTATKNTDETSSTISNAASQQKVEDVEDLEMNDFSEDTDQINKFANVDIFENVFNYQELEENEAEEDEETKNALVPTIIDDSYYYNTNTNCEYLMIEQQYDPFVNQIVNSSTSNISISLRNSLLKLRHSRRHLAALMEAHNQKLSKKAASNSNGSTTPTSSNSTTSSLTTTSNMSLYKQHLLNIQSSNTTSKKPCVYILNEGRCMRSDCRFVHDLKSITCKYWLEGECLKGETCEFLHDYVPTETSTTPLSFNYGNHKSTSFSSSFGSNNSSSTHFSHRSKQNKHEAVAAVVKKKDFKLDTEEFPALGGGTTLTTSSIPNQTGAIIENNSPVILTNKNNDINKNKNEDSIESNVNITKPEVKNLASVLKQQQSNTTTSAAPVKTAASVLLSNVINKTNTSTKPLNIIGSTSSKSNNNTQSTKQTANPTSSKSSNLNGKKNSTNTTAPVTIIPDENSSKTIVTSSKKKIKLNNSCSSSQSSLNSINTTKATTTTTSARTSINNNNSNNNNNHKKK